MTKEALTAVGEYLNRCQIARAPHVKSRWSHVELRNLAQDWDTETARLLIQDTKSEPVGGSDRPTILIHPCVDKFKPDYQAFCVLREFGYYLLLNAPVEMEVAWRLKLVLPTVAQIDAFQARLNGGYTSYAAVVESLQTPIDRLVASHLANAMMANGQAFAGAANVDIRKWGPTQEFANLRRFYSLVPLTSAYCPRTLDKEFGSAFAACVVYDLKTVTHSSVKEALQQLLERIINSAR